MRRPGPRGTLVLVLGLLLVTETALSPFYPALFRRLYGIEDLDATGRYLWICRLAGIAALPLWGLAARRWRLESLVAAGLGAAVVLDLALGLAPSYAAFTALSAALVAAGAAMLLAYPALVALDDGRPDPIRGVVSFAAVVYGSMVVSTLVGAAVMALPDPRIGIASFALLDAAVLLLIVRTLRGRGAPARGRARRASAWAGLRPLAGVALIAVVFELAAAVVRPFFVEWAVAEGASLQAAAALFLTAGVAALAMLPFARPLYRALGPALLPAALVVTAAGLAAQAVSTDVVQTVAGRILFGAGLGLSHVALDVRMFAAAGTDGPAFTGVETARLVALLAAPPIAATAAGAELALPLAVGALLMLTAAAACPLAAAQPTVEDARVANVSR